MVAGQPSGCNGPRQTSGHPRPSMRRPRQGGIDLSAGRHNGVGFGHWQALGWCCGADDSGDAALAVAGVFWPDLAC
jgi:hypothetical protein